MIKGGYILQPRCFDQSQSATMPPVARELWLYLLRKVNHKDGGGLRRGQGHFVIEDIQNALSWHVGYIRKTYSKSQLVKALRRLREGSMIASTKATRGMVITVLKYDYYQDPKNYEGTNEGSTKDTRRLYEGIQDKQEGRIEEVTTDHRDSKKDNGKFDDFWRLYPKKVGKVAALKAWQKAKCDLIAERIMATLPGHISSKQWTKNGGQYIPNPATWLNQGRWDDEVEEVSEWI